jgi:hypothetical protein
VLADLAAKYPGRVFALGFHVTYWDRQGWKDRFSDPAFSERQRAYARTLSLREVYTPQAIVNGSGEAVGSDRKRLEALVQQGLRTTATEMLEGKAEREGAGAWTVHYTTGDTSAIVNAALVQRTARTDVKGGENNGDTLTHINIVRAFATGKGAAGTLELKADLAAKDARLFLYRQNGTHITNAIEIPLD